jgi:hypothetical protein
MHISLKSVDYDRVAAIVPSSISSAPKPGYENPLQWLKHKTRRLVISLIVLNRRMVFGNVAEYRLVGYNGE